MASSMMFNVTDTRLSTNHNALTRKQWAMRILKIENEPKVQSQLLPGLNHRMVSLPRCSARSCRCCRLRPLSSSTVTTCSQTFWSSSGSTTRCRKRERDWTPSSPWKGEERMDCQMEGARISVRSIRWWQSYHLNLSLTGQTTSASSVKQVQLRRWVCMSDLLVTHVASQL